MSPAETSIESRLRLLEDHEEIRQLKAHYAHSYDQKFADDHRPLSQAECDALIKPMVEAVFSEDAEWIGGMSNLHLKGRQAIFDYLRQNPWNFSMHLYGNPLIAVDGDTAHASWMLLEPATRRSDNQAMWMAAVTEDDYVRTAQGWRLRRYELNTKFLTPFDESWAHG
ncbi:MAG: nuclear transport factor 2 family protein [Acidobacteriota bacterium]